MREANKARLQEVMRQTFKVISSGRLRPLRRSACAAALACRLPCLTASRIVVSFVWLKMVECMDGRRSPFGEGKESVGA